MTPSAMTGKMLKEWRQKMGYAQTFAAEKLGICVASFRSYENEKRSDKNKPVQIPVLVSWACSAISAGLKPYGSDKK